MNRLLYYGSVESIPFYNCSWKSQEEWFQIGQKRPFLGYPITIFGIFIELLYPPILYIIFKKKLIRHACYKIIVVLALVDMTATVCSCLISGPLFIQGAVFCSYPLFIYVSGILVLSTWCTSCLCTLLLFLNRIIFITVPQYSHFIDGNLAYLSLILIASYFTFWFFFTPTICFNSVGMAWYPDPLAMEMPSAEAEKYYRNTPQAWNNWIFVSVMVFLYVSYFLKVRKVAKGQQKSKAAKAIVVQCIIICFFNTVAALVYNSFTLITPDPLVLLIGQLCWSVNHGCPALIYITMNHTIRREFKRFIFRVTRIEDSAMSVTTSTNHKF